MNGNLTYIIQKNFRIEKEYIPLFPEISELPIGRKRRISKPFILTYKDTRISVVLYEQGHIKPVDKSLDEWFEKNAPKIGDRLKWYKTDKKGEFEIEFLRFEYLSQSEITHKEDNYTNIFKYRLEYSKHGIKLFMKNPLGTNEFEMRKFKLDELKPLKFSEDIYIEHRYENGELKTISIYFNELDKRWS